MTVNSSILSEFVKITNDNNKEKKIEKIYGTIVAEGDARYVKIDGSDIKTPVKTTTEINDNQRVIVSIDNHMAVVTGNISDPSVGNSRVESAEGSIGYFDHLFAGNITADNIKANSITTEKLMAGSITADKIATGAITAGSGIIAEGAIGSAQISKLDAAKITSGTLDTSDVTIAGGDGVLRIKDNRMQVFDGMGTNQFERVSIGDVNGDGTVFGLRVRGADGETILLDENGVTEEGITDGSISNDKINPNAGIEGGKLDIDSVIDTINKDGSKTINGVKIDIDAKGLDVIVQEINDKSTELDTNIQTNTADIKANSDSIKMKVDEQTYSTDKAEMTTHMTKNTTDINLLKEQIVLKVEQTDIDNTVNEAGKVLDSKIESAKSEIKLTTDSITNTVESMSMNTSRNLLMNTNFASNESKDDNWQFYTNGVPGTEAGWFKHQHAGFPVGEGIGVYVHKTGRAAECKSKTIRVSKGEKYTLSADILVEKNLHDGNILFREFKQDGTWFDAGIHTAKTNYQGRIEIHHTIQHEKTNALQIVFTNNGPTNDGTEYNVFFINRVQLERGDTANDWSLSHLDSVNFKFSEIKQTTDGITSSVDKHQNDLNWLASESSRIDQKANSIKSTVTGIQGDYVGQSQLTQTVNGFEFNVANTSQNILYGSAFNNTTKHWYASGYNTGNAQNLRYRGEVGGDWGIPGIGRLTIQGDYGSGFEYGVTQDVPVSRDTNYTFTCYVAAHRARGLVVIRGSDSNWLKHSEELTAVGGTNINNWTKVTITFNTAHHTNIKIQLSMHAADGDGYVWYTMPMLNRGSKAIGWSQNPNEVTSDVVMIDSTGVRVNHSSGDFSQMTSQGFKRHRNDGALKGDYHYLLHQGTIFCNSEQTVRIHLPSDFHGKRINAVAAAACIGSGTDAWDKPEPLVSFWAEVSGIASDSTWVDFYASTRQNRSGTILTQHKGIKFAYWITA